MFSQRQITSEIKTTLEPYDKETSDLHELKVVSSFGERNAYFLRNCATPGFSEQLDFRWLKKGKTIVSLTLAISKSQHAISLPKSPFGGIWVEKNLSSSALEGFIRAVLDVLRQRGIFSVSIIQPPKPYESNFDLINYFLFRIGFVQDSVISHQFFIGKKKIKNFVQERNSKYTLKSKEMGLKVHIGGIQNFGFLQKIKNWNQARGYEIFFDEGRLISQVSEYPERYYLISISKDGKALAYTLAVKLLENSIYYFLAASEPKSPVRNLGEFGLFHLFQLASEQKLNFIDLGSSDLDIGANHNLMFFKSRFSNDISNKVTWTLTL